jgi:predicted amidophosphoribosyltransferase
MPLVTCPDCQTEISSAAPACQKCGRPVAKPLWIRALRILGLLVVGMALLWILVIVVGRR